MNSRVLVTFSTCTGYTAGIAESIANILAENGLDADLVMNLKMNENPKTIN